MINQFSSQLPMHLRQHGDKRLWLVLCVPHEWPLPCREFRTALVVGYQAQAFSVCAVAQRGLSDFKDYILFKNAIKECGGRRVL